MPVSFHDLAAVDRRLFENLVWILNAHNVGSLFLDFTINVDVLGEVEEILLKSGGADIPLTDENKEEYIRRAFEYHMMKSISHALEQVSEKCFFLSLSFSLSYGRIISYQNILHGHYLTLSASFE